jgi:hypothetical protein
MARPKLNLEGIRLGSLIFGERVEAPQPKFKFTCADCGNKGEMEARHIAKGCRRCSGKSASQVLKTPVEDSEVLVVLEMLIMRATTNTLAAAFWRHKNPTFYYEDQRVEVEIRDGNVCMSKPGMYGLGAWHVFPLWQQDTQEFDMLGPNPSKTLEIHPEGKIAVPRSTARIQKLEQVVSEDYDEEPHEEYIPKGALKLADKDDAQYLFTIDGGPVRQRMWMESKPEGSTFVTYEDEGCLWAKAVQPAVINDFADIEAMPDLTAEQLAAINRANMVEKYGEDEVADYESRTEERALAKAASDKRMAARKAKEEEEIAAAELIPMRPLVHFATDAPLE